MTGGSLTPLTPVVQESDRDLWTWMIVLCILGTHPWRKRSKKPLTLPNLIVTATSSFFQHAFEFQQSFKLHIRLKDDSKFMSTTSVLR